MANASLRVSSDLKNLSAIRDFVEAAATEAGLSADGISEIRLAVDEACANIMIHGYQNGSGQIDISVVRDEEKMIVTLSDNAPPYNPLEAPYGLDLEAPLEDRPLGGMGVLLVIQNTDAVNSENKPFTQERLTALLTDAPTNDHTQTIVRELQTHMGEAPLFDDITILTVTRK